MNPSDWKKAATLVTQHKQEATMAEMDQLCSMPLSQIAIDDSGLPVVHYGSHVPVAASTSTGTIAHTHTAHSRKIFTSRLFQVSLSFIMPYFIIT